MNKTPLLALAAILVGCNPSPRFPETSVDDTAADDTAETGDTDTDTDADADTDADSDADTDTGTADPNDVDNDGDGYTENGGDCEDADASINPGADEIADDGIDQDCDGVDTTTGEASASLFAIRLNITYIGEQDWLCYGYTPDGTAEIDANAEILITVDGSSSAWHEEDMVTWSPTDGTVNDGCSAVLYFGEELRTAGNVGLWVDYPYAMDMELTYQLVGESDQLGDWWEPSVVVYDDDAIGASIAYDFTE